jgi:hypothetical protein
MEDLSGNARDESRGRFGRWVRLAIGSQVAAGLVLALAAAALVTWLAGRSALRWRADLTVERRNTLPEELAQIVRGLPEPVQVEIFFQEPRGIFAVPALEAQARMRELLFLARAQFPDKLRVIEHDLADRAGASNRMRELELEEVDVVVAFAPGREKSRGVLKLLRDIARVDPGDPRLGLQPSLEGFRGEVALAEALLKAARSDTPKVYFSSGHGERDPFDSEPRQLGKLESALVSEGFAVGRWDPKAEPGVPGECHVLALVAPTQPFAPGELEAIERFLAQGGRVFIAPNFTSAAFDGPGSVSEWLRTRGIEPQAGLVAQFVRSATGALVDGEKECATLAVGPPGMDRHHPITESLWRARVVLPISGSRAFRRGKTGSDTVLLDLLRSPAESWLDLPDAQGRHDWRRDATLEDGSGGFVLAFAATFGAPAEVGSTSRQGRLVVFGSAESMSSALLDYTRDFLLNAFNWLAEREYRVAVRPRKRKLRQIDLKSTPAHARIYRVAALGLPGLCALLGAWLAWRRRR